MALGSTQRQIRIDEVVLMLEAGKTTGEIVQICTNSYKCGDDVVNKYIKEAKLIILSRNQAKELERQANVSEALKNEIQAEILTEQELDLIMSRIVDGNIEVAEYIKGERIIRDTSPMEIIAAADKLYKRKGSYAPTKQSQTRPDGSELPDTNFTDDQVDKILNAIKDSKAF